MADSNSGQNFTAGGTFYKVPMALFAKNRQRICERLRNIPDVPDNSVILLKGGQEESVNYTDITYVFRQESYFNWAFGVIEPDFWGAIVVKTGESILFAPRLDQTYAIWMGPLKTLKDFQKKYEVDRVDYVENIKDVLKNLNPCLLLTLHGLNSDSHLEYPDPTFDGINEFKVNNSILYDEIADCRVFKTAYEIDVIRYTNFVSSKAHKHVMRAIRNGMTEFQCESLFLNFCYLLGGCRHVSYTCICGSGQNSSVLHYGHAGAPNDKVIKQKDMCLFDMGCSYYGYSSDITCSFPVSGKFTDDQKLIYNAVLDANQAVFQASKPGVSWVDMHRLANKVLLTHLRDGGLLKGEIDDMMNANLGAVFQPHGLGHLMGCDVHDVGGYLKKNPSRPSGAGLSNLRTARILEAGMVMTNEPGCYFIDFLLKQASEDPIQSKFLVPEVIERFRNFGGVRIEDDILINENGAENLTAVPRTVEEIEKWMNSDEEEPLHQVLQKNIVSLEYNLSNGHNQEAI